MPSALRDEIYDITELGPYVRYRWSEDKHLYTISLGLLDDDPPLPFTPATFSQGFSAPHITNYLSQQNIMTI